MTTLHHHFKLDFRSNVPIYVQITNQIQQMIADGTLKAGDQLPTVRQMATELRINFNTVARAYRMLDENGLISTQQGRGTFIWNDGDERTREDVRQNSLENLAAAYFDEAIHLGFSADEAIRALQNRILEGDRQ